jgi:hypothetical protein
MPLCCVPSKSPGPRSFKSASAISKPSLVRTIISKRFLVSSANYMDMINYSVFGLIKIEFGD